VDRGGGQPLEAEDGKREQRVAAARSDGGAGGKHGPCRGGLPDRAGAASALPQPCPGARTRAWTSSMPPRNTPAAAARPEIALQMPSVLLRSSPELKAMVRIHG